MITTATEDALPILPVRDVVVFPGMRLPLFVKRPKSVRAIEHAIANTKEILLVAQRTAALEDPGEGDLYGVGTIATIIERTDVPGSAVKLLVEGRRRARLCGLAPNDGFLEGRVEYLDDPMSAESIAERLRSPEVDVKVARMQALLEADLPTPEERLRRLGELWRN